MTSLFVSPTFHTSHTYTRMSVRGKPAYLRPISPPDPSLATRPVPRIRHFPIRSFGAGAAPDIDSTARSLKELDAEAHPTPCSGDYCQLFDEIRNLLIEVERWEAVIFRNDVDTPYRNPTWGFYVFVTAYLDRVRESLPKAIDFLITATDRNCRRSTLPVYAKEAVKRFKLDVIQDETTLAVASDDRIREEFRALIRGQHITRRRRWNSTSCSKCRMFSS